MSALPLDVDDLVVTFASEELLGLTTSGEETADLETWHAALSSAPTPTAAAAARKSASPGA